MSSSPEHKRREIQKKSTRRERKREKRKTRKIKAGIRNTSRPTALAAPNTPRAPSPFDACCATTSSSPRTLYTSSSSLSLSLFSPVCVFLFGVPIVYFFPGCSVNTKIPRIDVKIPRSLFWFGRAIDREEKILNWRERNIVKKVSRYAWIKIAKIAEEKNFLESWFSSYKHTAST